MPWRKRRWHSGVPVIGNSRSPSTPAGAGVAGSNATTRAGTAARSFMRARILPRLLVHEVPDRPHSLPLTVVRAPVVKLGPNHRLGPRRGTELVDVGDLVA